MTASSLLSAACAALALLSPASAFVPSTIQNAKIAQSSALSMANDGEVSRRGFFDNMASTTAAIAGASSILMTPSPAMAYGLGKANDRLSRWVMVLFVCGVRICAYLVFCTNFFAHLPLAFSSFSTCHVQLRSSCTCRRS